MKAVERAGGRTGGGGKEVLANIRVCDLLLRLAETPPLYLPFWSETILDETQRTHTGRLGWPADLSESWRSEVTRFFPDACVDNLECTVSPEGVNEKDRHVVQAALRAGAGIGFVHGVSKVTPLSRA